MDALRCANARTVARPTPALAPVITTTSECVPVRIATLELQYQCRATQVRMQMAPDGDWNTIEQQMGDAHVIMKIPHVNHTWAGAAGMQMQHGGAVTRKRQTLRLAQAIDFQKPRKAGATGRIGLQYINCPRAQHAAKV